MTYRDILVQIDEGSGSKRCATVAANLAARWGAHLTGIFLKPAIVAPYLPTDPVIYMSQDAVDAMVKAEAAAIAESCEQARRIFEQAAREAGARSDWLEKDGLDDRELVNHARRADLTILPPLHQGSWGRSAGSLGLASGGPLLLVPEAWEAPLLGARILVAWKGTRESARALRDAWPFLKAAQSVHVLIVVEEGDSEPDQALQRHFEHHSCPAEVIVDHSHDASATDIIRRHIKDLSIELVVMGLYGRSRLQELILGGVSRDLLKTPPCALLMSH